MHAYDSTFEEFAALPKSTPPSQTPAQEIPLSILLAMGMGPPGYKRHSGHSADQKSIPRQTTQKNVTIFGTYL